MLVSIFNLGGVDIQESEFLKTYDGQTYLTTDPLPSKVEIWKDQWEGEEFLEERRFRWALTKHVLDEVKTYINAFEGILCPTFDNALVGSNKGSARSPISDEILTAIVALAYTLSEITIKAYHAEWNAYDHYINYTTLLLKSSLEERGWCRLDVKRMLTHLGTDGQYYFALLECPQGKESHEDCSERQCLAANNVDERAYVTQHFMTCDGNDGITAETAAEITEKVVDIIREGGIPVISWKEDEVDTASKLQICDALVGGVKFVAISHVWADGLGNPHENSLPECQLRRIQGLISSLKVENSGALKHFWMDTICVPLGKENKQYRKMAIARMAEIYGSSAAVLVLDLSLQEIFIHDSIPDKIAKIYVCNWLHRLWTVQESSLADNVYVQFDEGAQSFDYIEKQCRLYGASVQIPKDLPLYIRFPGQIAEAAISYMGAIRIFKNKREPDHGIVLGSGYLAHLSRAFEHRSTSKIEDEAICASTLLGLDTMAILRIDDKDWRVVAEKRMEEFWKQLRGMSKGIIFNHSPRLRKQGFRWAPKSLMGGRSGDFWRDYEGGAVEFDGQSLTVAYPGIALDEPILPPPGGTIIVKVLDEPLTYYSIELFPETDKYPEWRISQWCGIAMFRPITPGSAGVDAILGIYANNPFYRTPNKITILFQARATVKAWTSERIIENSVAGSLLGTTHEWKVY